MENYNYRKFVIVNLDEFNSILNRYRLQKNVFNNFYGFSECISDNEIYMDKCTLIIRKLENDFYRCYIISSDYSELVSILKSFKFNHAINIPSKGSIEEWCKLLNECGYIQTGMYERMFYDKIRCRTKREPRYAGLGDLEDIYNTLYLSFNKINDHLPDRVTLEKMIVNNQVLINQNMTDQIGVLIFTINGKRGYLNAWIDNSGEGLLLLFDIFNVMVLKGIKYINFWVNSTNIEVKRIHQLLGAKYDGLKDYTFVKQHDNEN